MNLTTRSRTTLASALVLAALAAPLGCESDKKAAAPAPAAAPMVAVPAKPLSVEESARVQTTARVTAIDQTTRMVTLEMAEGRTITLVAGDQVRRLNEVNVGDSVVADYIVTLLAELRPATAEEAASPITYVEIAGRTPQGTAPAGGVGRGLRMVTTVQAVDQPSMRVTLRGPGGDTFTVKGRRPENIAKLKVGDTIVITFTESLAVGLEKAAK